MTQIARNLKVVLVNPQVFASMFTHEARKWERVEALPAGSKLVRTGYDDRRDLLYFIFEHESFPHVPDGGKIPEFLPTFRAMEENPHVHLWGIKEYSPYLHCIRCGAQAAPNAINPDGSVM